MGAFAPYAEDMTNAELEAWYGDLSDDELREQYDAAFQWRDWATVEVINEEWQRRDGTRVDPVPDETITESVEHLYPKLKAGLDYLRDK